MFRTLHGAILAGLLLSITQSAAADTLAQLDFDAANFTSPDLVYTLGGQNSVVSEQQVGIDFLGALSGLEGTYDDVIFTLSGVDTVALTALGVPVGPGQEEPPNIVGGNMHGYFTQYTQGGTFTLRHEGQVLLEGTLGGGELHFSTVNAQGTFVSTGAAFFTGGTLLSLLDPSGAGLSLVFDHIVFENGRYEAHIGSAAISGSGSTAVPEPASALLLLSGCLLARRKR